MPMPPNLNKMLEQAQKLQEEMAAAQEKLKDEKVESSSGGGMVKVVATGEGRLESLTIDPDAVDPEDVELLQDMVLAAVNEALRQADDLREKAIQAQDRITEFRQQHELTEISGSEAGDVPDDPAKQPTHEDPRSQD